MKKKKSIVAAGVASLAVAAMPMAGVFAAGDTTVTDTVQVTIGSACTITTSQASNTYSDTMTNGQLKSDFGSTSMTINCNDAAGWHLQAVGSGADTSNKTAMNATGTGTDIATGTATSGGTSNWAMMVTDDTGSSGGTATGFTSFSAVPGSATDVAKSTAPTSGSKVKTTYQVFISATQQADTYTGQVTYTLTHPAS